MTAPFDDAPVLFTTPHFGAPVEQGKEVSARLADGSTVLMQEE